MIEVDRRRRGSFCMYTIVGIDAPSSIFDTNVSTFQRKPASYVQREALES
jgi:hypothetical protein